MKLVILNIRGINKTYKQKHVRKLLSTNIIGILELIEHKIKEQYVSKVVRKIAPGWPLLANYNYSFRGMSLVLWNLANVNITLESMIAQIIYAKVHITALNYNFSFTIVYGFHMQRERGSMWTDLRAIHSK